MKQLIAAISLITASMLLYACPKYEVDYITFVNKSEKWIVCQPFSIPRHFINTDTLFRCGIGAIGILPDSLYKFSSLNHSGWETDFRAISHMQFLVMDTETYSKYIAEPCDTIRKYVPILHRYQLTLEDLQRMNWTVVYPPEK